jgi:hypothetical protein
MHLKKLHIVIPLFTSFLEKKPNQAETNPTKLAKAGADEQKF